MRCNFRDSPVLVGISLSGVGGPLNAPCKVFCKRLAASCAVYRSSSAMAKHPSAPYARKLKYIATPEITKCIFCGTGGPLTQEHVFSKWTHRYLSTARMGKYHSVRGIRNPTDSEHHVIKRLGDIRDWQIRCVCDKTCNNGWMRQLVEDRARPALLPLIKGDSLRINPAQQELIATWATMKAMVTEWMIRGHVTTNHMQRKRMMWKQLPPSKIGEFG